MQSVFFTLDRVLKKLYLLSGYAAATSLIIIAILVLLSIVSRMLSIYIPGLTEYSGYAMVSASFLALAYTFDNHGHIRVELAISRLDEAKRWYAEIWCLSVATLVAMLLSFYMSKLVYWSWRFKEHSEGSDAILMWKPQSIAAIGSCIFSICVLHHLIKCVANRPKEPVADGRT